MIDCETVLGFLFYLCIGLSLVSLAALRGKGGIMKFIPWAAVLSGVVYLASAEIYYSREDVQVTVPIRVDLLILPTFLAIPIAVGIIRLKKRR